MVDSKPYILFSILRIRESKDSRVRSNPTFEVASTYFKFFEELDTNSYNESSGINSIV